MLTSPIKPKAYPSIFKCLDDPTFGPDWNEALFFQYDKNHRICLMSQPAAIESLPKDKKIIEQSSLPKSRRMANLFISWSLGCVLMVANNSKASILIIRIHLQQVQLFSK
jgi:hypothetical protein